MFQDKQLQSHKITSMDLLVIKGISAELFNSKKNNWQIAANNQPNTWSSAAQTHFALRQQHYLLPVGFLAFEQD